MTSSAFMFLFGTGIWASEMISMHDSRQNAKLEVLESKMIALEASVTDIKTEMSKKEAAKEERSLYVFGALIATMGTFGAAVFSAIYSRGTRRELKEELVALVAELRKK
jgi:hypothetical protein